MYIISEIISWVISSYFVTKIFCSYIFRKNFEKSMYENKNILFKQFFE